MPALRAGQCFAMTMRSWLCTVCHLADSWWVSATRSCASEPSPPVLGSRRVYPGGDLEVADDRGERVAGLAGATPGPGFVAVVEVLALAAPIAAWSARLVGESRSGITAGVIGRDLLAVRDRVGEGQAAVVAGTQPGDATECAGSLVLCLRNHAAADRRGCRDRNPVRRWRRAYNAAGSNIQYRYVYSTLTVRPGSDGCEFDCPARPPPGRLATAGRRCLVADRRRHDRAGDVRIRSV